MQKEMNGRHSSSEKLRSFNGDLRQRTTPIFQERYFWIIPLIPLLRAQVVILLISSRETTLILINITSDKGFLVIKVGIFNSFFLRSL